MSNSHTDVMVVGGGIVGAMCAYYLSREGKTVTLIDREHFAAGASHGNCGYICPSHALPLTQPGVVKRMGLKALKKSSPLYIKPRFSPALWKWLYNFRKRCNREDMLRGADALNSLLPSSRTLYEQYIKGENLVCDWDARGLMFVYQDKHELDEYQATADLLKERYDLHAVKYDADALLKAEPALKPGAAAGAWMFPIDAHFRPDLFMQNTRKLLESRGVKIIDRCEMQGFTRANGDARAVLTNQGELSADQFVIATGAMTTLIAKHLGCRIPIQPGKGYSITMPRPGICPTYPMIFETHRVAVTPWASGYRIGSTMEFAGYDTYLDPVRLENLKRGAEFYLKEPHCEPITEKWYGWRPMTWDSLPIIDRAPQLGNVVIAAGHNMLGMSLGAVTGKLVAEMLTGQTPHVDLKPFRASRFS